MPAPVDAHGVADPDRGPAVSAAGGREAGWWRRFRRHPQGRVALLVTGWVILLSAPVVGLLPGPGFIILAPIGLTLILQSSRGAQRRYVRLSRSFPTWGDRADRILRRASAARRRLGGHRDGAGDD